MCTGSALFDTTAARHRRNTHNTAEPPQKRPNERSKKTVYRAEEVKIQHTLTRSPRSLTSARM